MTLPALDFHAKRMNSFHLSLHQAWAAVLEVWLPAEVVLRPLERNRGQAESYLLAKGDLFYFCVCCCNLHNPHQSSTECKGWSCKGKEIVVKDVGFGVKVLGFKFVLHHLLTVWSYMSDLTFLDLHVLIYNMVITVMTRVVVIKWDNMCKESFKVPGKPLACNKH